MTKAKKKTRRRKWVLETAVPFTRKHTKGKWGFKSFGRSNRGKTVFNIVCNKCGEKKTSEVRHVKINNVRCHTCAHNAAIQEINKLNNGWIGVEFSGERQGNNALYTVQCAMCGDNRNAQLGTLRLNRVRCQQCAHNAAIQEINKLNNGWIGVEFSGERQGRNALYTVQCATCGDNRNARMDALRINSVRCHQCAHNAAIQEINKLNNGWIGVEFSGERQGNNALYTVQCATCGDKKDARMDNLRLNLVRCHQCAHNAAIQEINKLNNGWIGVEFSGERQGNGAALYTVQCAVCGDKKDAQMHHLRINNVRCNTCSSTGKYASHFERMVGECLEEHGISFRREVTFKGLRGKGGGLLRVDFLASWEEHSEYSDVVAISVQGKQHYERVPQWQTKEQFHNLRHHDQLKRDHLAKLGIAHVEIKYTDRNNISDIIENVVIPLL